MDLRAWYSLIWTLFLFLFPGLETLPGNAEDIHAPCYACRIFNLMQRDNPKHDPKGIFEELEQRKSHRFAALHLEEFCEFPCQCPIMELKCNEGVKVIRDGCDCCYMCARQHGDRCSPKERCAEGLYCHLGDDNRGVGICKARDPKPCEVHSSFYRNGKRVVKKRLYRDGEQVQPDCSHMCTCQNGNFGCVSLCPQEEKKPSKKHCKNPRLVTVAGQCCGEWWCDTDTNYTRRVEIKSGSTSNVIAYDPRRDENYIRHVKPSTNPPVPQTTTPPIRPPCAIVQSEWSACSASCGVGMSVRMTNDNLECEDVQQTRICFIRPCGELVKSEKRTKCTPTAKGTHKHRIEFQDCRSVKEHRLKFCSNCKKNRCCYPQITRHRTIEFECSKRERVHLSFMWIKKCQCGHKCYGNRIIDS